MPPTSKSPKIEPQCQNMAKFLHFGHFIPKILQNFLNKVNFGEIFRDFGIFRPKKVEAVFLAEILVFSGTWNFFENFLKYIFRLKYRFLKIPKKVLKLA